MSNPVKRIVTKNSKFVGIQLRNSRRIQETENWIELSKTLTHEGREGPATGTRIEPEEFMASEWKIDGTVIRFEEIGSVEVATGGSVRIAGIGTLRIWPASDNFYSSTILHRLMLRGGNRVASDWAGYGSPPGFEKIAIRAVVLVDQLTGRAMLAQSGGRNTNTGLASSWIGGGVHIQTSGDEDWTAEEIRRSRAYFFTARPVARVEAVLPPPGE